MEAEIQQALQTIPPKARDNGWTDSQWTKAVKEEIIKVCKRSGSDWQASASQCGNANTGEWMYDVVCWRYDGQGNMIAVPLVAECEWGNEDQIKDDFEKLLVSRSKFRVMVFQAGSEESVKRIFDDMKGWVRMFQGTKAEDRYLLAGWSPDSNRFSFNLHVAPPSAYD